MNSLLEFQLYARLRRLPAVAVLVCWLLVLVASAAVAWWCTKHVLVVMIDLVYSRPLLCRQVSDGSRNNDQPQRRGAFDIRVNREAAAWSVGIVPRNGGEIPRSNQRHHRRRRQSRSAKIDGCQTCVVVVRRRDLP